MKILATGGAGYIGSHTCVELLNQGYDVVVVDNFSNSSPKSLERVAEITGKKIQVYNCDILDREGLKKVFSENKIDAVIHFAGLKAVGESCAEPMKYYRNNISGTVNLLEVMAEAGCKNLVFSSSATVYGDNNYPCDENAQTGVGITNPYGRTKYMIEEILKDVAKADEQWHITLLRYFNPIGAHPSGKIGEDPYGIPNNLMPFVAQVAVGRRECLSVFGDDYETPDGTGVRDYIHVCDLAVGHACAIKRQINNPGVEVYNLGSGKGTSVLELVNAFEKESGQKINYKIADRRPGDLPYVYAKVEKAEEYLGFKVQFDVNAMCRDTWNWQKNNPNGYEK